MMRDATASLPAQTLSFDASNASRTHPHIRPAPLPGAENVSGITLHLCRGSRKSGADDHGTSWMGCMNVAPWRCT